MILINPMQVKALQGRKSDQREARRIAEFLQDRRLDASYVPPRPIRELRILLRHRVALLEQRNEVHNQIRDLLETACIKLSSVASDLMGMTGRGILRALADGQTSPEQLSWQARGKLRQKMAEIKEAVRGDFSDFHRTLLRLYLQHYESVSTQIAEFELLIDAKMQPYQEQVDLLTTIPGMERLTAWGLLAELGPEMSVFPDAQHCASWAGLAPGTQESAGIQKTGRTKKGNRYLRRILTQSAWANAHRKDGYLRALFHRVKARRGWAKAIVAVAHKLLVIAYHMLKNRSPYKELGGDYFDLLHPEKAARRLSGRLQRMGYTVTLTRTTSIPPPPPAPWPPPDPTLPRKRGRPRKYPRPVDLTPFPSNS
jgi:transposase